MFQPISVLIVLHLTCGLLVPNVFIHVCPLIAYCLCNLSVQVCWFGSPAIYWWIKSSTTSRLCLPCIWVHISKQHSDFSSHVSFLPTGICYEEKWKEEKWSAKWYVWTKRKSDQTCGLSRLVFYTLKMYLMIALQSCFCAMKRDPIEQLSHLHNIWDRSFPSSLTAWCNTILQHGSVDLFFIHL